MQDNIVVEITVFHCQHCSSNTATASLPIHTVHSTPQNILYKLLSHITIVSSMDCGERGMNPLAMTVINLRKEHLHGSGSGDQHPSVLKSLNPFPNLPWFLPVCSTSLLKTLWEKEKLLVMMAHKRILKINNSWPE